MSSRKDNEEPLKALVFADSCGAAEPHVFPCTRKLLNIPILSWQLATLARYGVKEAVVLSSKPVDDLYEDPLGRMKVTPLSSPSWSGEGDAMRDVESRDSMRPVDDFVLVRQGSVFNVDVAKLVAAHKSRKEADRNWLITAVFRRGAGASATGLVLGVDSPTGTLVKYVEKLGENGISIDVLAENAGLQGGGTFEICSDVLDVGLDVCAPDFLLEFRENFYYDRVRAYIKEKLDGGEAEVFGNRMFAHFLDSSIGQYGTRIQSIASLAQATSDALGGWLSPMTPALINGTPRENRIHAFQSEYLLEQSTMGADVSVSVGSMIVDSVIGNNVKIGSDVNIKHSILMDGTEVRDRCEIDRSVIEENCIVADNALVTQYSYLGTGVCIGSDFTRMNPHSLITLQDSKTFETEVDTSEDDDDDDDDNDDDDEHKGKESQTGGDSKEVANGVADIEAPDSERAWSADDVGKGGKGRLIDAALAGKVDPFFLAREKIFEPFYFESEEEDELEEEDDTLEAPMEETSVLENGEVEKLGEQLDGILLEADSNAGADREESQIAKFNEEALETIERAFAEDIDVENTTLEMNSLKMIYQCTFAETLTGIIAGLARTSEKNSSAEELYPSLHTALDKYSSLVQKFNNGQEPIHHFNVASGLASALSENGTLLMYVYKAMYEKDMLEEDGILGWAAAEEKRIDAGNGNEALLTTVSPLIEWLEGSEEED